MFSLLGKSILQMHYSIVRLNGYTVLGSRESGQRRIGFLDVQRRFSCKTGRPLLDERVDPFGTIVGFENLFAELQIGAKILFGGFLPEDPDSFFYHFYRFERF